MSTHVTSINKTLRDVQSMDIMSLPTSNVARIATEFATLDKAQKAVYLSTAELSKEQKNLMLSYAQSISQGQLFDTTILKNQLHVDQLSDAQRRQLELIIRKNSVQKQGVLIDNQQANAILNKLVKKKLCNQATAESIQKELAASAATQALTKSTLSQVKANLALIASNPTTWITAAVTLISLIVKAYNEWNVTLEEQVEKLNEARSNLETATSEYDSLNATIEETTSRIEQLKKLEAAGSITLVEQNELDKLKAANDLYAERLALLEAEQAFAKIEHEQAFTDTFTKATKLTDPLMTSGLYGWVYANDNKANLRVNTNEQFQKYLAIDYDELFELRKEEIDNIDAELDAVNTKLIEALQNNDTKLVDQLKQQRDELEKALQFQKTELSSIASTFSESYNELFMSVGGDFSKLSTQELREAMEKIREWRAFIASGFGGKDANESRYDSIVETGVYDTIIDKLVDLAKQGELTEDILNSAEYSPLINALRALGVPIDWLIEKFQLLAGEQEEAGAPTLTPLQKYVASTQPAAAASTSSAALGDVMSEYNENGFVTEETLNALETAIPGVTNALLNADGTWSKAGQKILTYKDNLHAATVAMYEAIIAQEKLKLQASIDESTGPDAIEGKDYNAEQAGITANIDALEAQLDALKGGWQAQLYAIKGSWQDAIGETITGLNSSTDLLVQAMSDLNDGAFKAWDSAFVEKLIEAFPDLTDEIKNFADGTEDAESLSEDFFDALTTSHLNEFTEALQDVSDAVEDYGEDSPQVEESLENLEAIIPGVTGLLYDESGGLTEVGNAALLAAQGNIEAARSILQAALAAAQADMSNLVAEWNTVKQAADAAAQSNINAAYTSMMANQQLTIDQIQGMLDGLNNMSSLPKSSGGGGGGGGSSKKDVLEDYKAQKKILEHRIDMSEAAQDLMSEESDSWEAEQSKQLSIYKEYADLIQAEMERLRALGYDNYSEELMQLEKDLASVQKAMYDIAKASWERQRDAQIEALRKQKEAAEEAHEAEMERLDAEIDRNETLLGLLETQYDLTSSLRDERHELEKELAAANSYTAMSDAERDALFSQADYAQLVGVLDEIQNEAIIAYNQYIQKIKAVSTEEAYKLDYITSEYEAQYALMAKKYEIAKQELAVARARIALENAQKNRSVAMLVNGQWTWSADPQAIEQAMDEIWEAEQEKADAESEYFHQQKVNEYEMFIAQIELQKEAAEAQHEKLMEQIDKLIESLEEMEFALDDCVNGLYASADAISGAISAIQAAAASASASISSLVDRGGLDDGDLGGTKRKGKQTTTLKSKADPAQRESITVTIDKNKKDSNNSSSGHSGGATASSVRVNMAYADGGVNTTPGLAMMHGSPSSPEVVFNAKDASKLYDLIHNGNLQSALFEQMVRLIHSNAPSIVSDTTTTKPTIQYIINGLKLGESAGGLTLRELANQLTSAAPLLR